MDPITVLVAAGTTLKVVKEIWEGLQWMQQIYETYTEGDKTLQSIALECNIYGESIKTIGYWLKKNQKATGLARQIRTTHNAITLVQVSMANVLLDLKKFQDAGDLTGIKDKKISKQKMQMKLFQQFAMNKIKMQWFQETMRVHLVELRAHAATLHLTLGVIELAGYTPEQKEKMPEQLEAKTGKLEKRLLLRQIITRALELKRKEIAELARCGNLEQATLTHTPNPIKHRPQKLTFFDVVQLARQQAMAEKTRVADDDISTQTSKEEVETRMSNEDLIDFSDTPPSLIGSASSVGGHHDHHLFDLDHPITPHRENYSSVSQGDTRASRLALPVEMEGSHPILAELDVGSSPKRPVGYLHELVELPASQPTIVMNQEPTKSSNPAQFPKQPIFELCQSGEVATSPKKNSDSRPSTLDIVCAEAIRADDLTSDETKGSFVLEANRDQSIFSLDLSTKTFDDTTSKKDKAHPDDSPTSTAAPSIFSHTSSLTSATGPSLSGITEQELRARSSLSQASIRTPSLGQEPFYSLTRKTTFGSAKPLVSTSPAHDNSPELCKSPSADTTPPTHTVTEIPIKLQQTQPADNVSISPPLPQLSDLDKPDEQGFPWIVQAARDGDEETIRKLLISGANITAFHVITRRHALLEASLHGHQGILDLLIDEGCPLDLPDADGNTALHHASREGLLNVAKRLIKGGASVNASGPQGQTPLHLAMQVPHQNLVMLLIQHKANVNARDAGFKTPLHIGAMQGNAAMCRYLLNEGAQHDSREAQSRTPLQLACEAGHYDLVQVLLDHSNLPPTSMSFLSAFYTAIEHSHVQIAESFFSHGLMLQEIKSNSHKPACLSAKSGCLAMVELMIQSGCDTNARDEKGWNALHFASYHGHYQIIERLLASNVSTKATTSRKETPLLLAIKGGHFAVAERLLRNHDGSKIVTLEDERCEKPIHHAVRAGSKEVFDLLMSNGAKINVENSFGWRPIHIATAYGHLGLVERLLQEGANIEDKLGSTSVKKDQTHKIVEEGYWAEARWPYPGSRPLHLASEYGHDQLADFLISKGAKMEASCSEGWQPLHHAAYFGSSALVEKLLRGGVDPHAATSEGKTAQGLRFCTHGAPIPDEVKHRIQTLLEEAMDKSRKQKSFKINKPALKSRSTVEEKNSMIRAAYFSKDVIARPPLHRASTTAQAIDSKPAQVDLTQQPLRPQLNHLPYTSPLPSTYPSSVSGSHVPTTPYQPPERVEAVLPAITAETSSESVVPNASTTEIMSRPQTINSDKSPPLPNNTIIAAPTRQMEVSAPPEPKITRRSTFGFAKIKPGGMDMAKFSISSMGKPASELEKQTFDIGKQTLGLGKQGIDITKQGWEKSRQGLETIQGLEMGKRGVDIGKTGLKKAKTFAAKGRAGVRRKRGTSKEVNVASNSENGTKDDRSKAIEDVGGQADDNDDDDISGSDVAGSEFSLGEFADVGNDDF